MKIQKEKDKLLAELKSYQEMDAFIKGIPLSSEKTKNGKFKGDFHGCIMQTYDDPVEKFAKKYDIDLWYCYLTKRIFRGMPNEESKKFPYESIEILPLNFDFNKIKSPFHKEVLIKKSEFIKNAEIKKTITDAAQLFDVPFNEIDKEAAQEAWPAVIESAPLFAIKSAIVISWTPTEWSSVADENHHMWLRDLLFRLIK